MCCLEWATVRSVSSVEGHEWTVFEVVSYVLRSNIELWSSKGYENILSTENRNLLKFLVVGKNPMWKVVVESDFYDCNAECSWLKTAYNYVPNGIAKLFFLMRNMYEVLYYLI